MGVDPELRDPDGGDFSLKPGSPATGFGCQTFATRSTTVRGRGGLVPSSSSEVVWAGRDGWREPDLTVPRVAHDGRSGPDPTVPRAAHAPGALRASFDVSGQVLEDTFWSADTVRVVGPLEVVDGVTLGIDAGVRVEFQGFHDLTVDGRVLAVGTAAEPVVFTSSDPAAFLPDSSSVGAWGGIRFDWTSSGNERSVFEHCVFECAKGLHPEAVGGALTVTGFSKLLVRNSLFRSNAAVYGGAVGCTQQAAPEFVGCLFEGNSAFETGSALYSEYSYPGLVACTLADNTVLNAEPFDPAGVVHNHIAKTRVASSIVCGNESIYFIDTQMVEAKPYYVTYSNVEDLGEGLGNIDAEPLFVGHGASPYAILPGSPCEDAGEPDTLGMGLASCDLAGEPRLKGGRLDMGAHEGMAGAGVDEGFAAGTLALACRRNPAAGRTVVALTSPAAAVVRVDVFDAAGRRVTTMADRRFPAGTTEIAWDARGDHGLGAANGVYFVRAESASGERAVAKVVLLR